MIRNGLLALPGNGLLLGIDAEWTKNYKVKNGNVPFCFSIVAIKKSDMSFVGLKEGKIRFHYIQYYCEQAEEAEELAMQFDDYIKQVVNSLENCILCGHQLSSDISIFINYAKYKNINLFYTSKIKSLWRDRRENNRIFDTRYDIYQSFLGKSRRLVDMSNDFYLDVTQPELGNKSMTSLHNEYIKAGTKSIRERISVMNIRHSLCSIVLYWLNDQVRKGETLGWLNINKIINYNLYAEFDWIKSGAFQSLIS